MGTKGILGSGRLPALLAALFLAAAGLATAFGSEAGAPAGGASPRLVYVAGVEDNYPVEYYDQGEGRFRGILPALLEEAGKESGLTFHYLPPGEERLNRAKNLQVEVLSAWRVGDDLPQGLTLGEVCLTLPGEAGEESYCLAYTTIAGENLRAAVEGAVASLDPRVRERILLREAFGLRSPRPGWLAPLLWGLGAVCAALAAAVLLLQSRLQRKLREPDPVTGGMRMSAMRAEMEERINHLNRVLYAATVVEVENFSAICELYGPQRGNAVLRTVSAAIQSQIDVQERFARLYGNEFVLFTRFVNIKDAGGRLDRLFKEIRARVREEEGGNTVVLRAGLYQLQPTDDNLEKIILRASQAKRYARQNSLELVAAGPAVLREIEGDRLLEQEAIVGFRNGEFVSYYQPKVDVSTGEIVGAEALTRWQNPRHGLLFPSRFIPILEANQLITELDMTMFRGTCRALAGIQGRRLPIVSVNFSRQCFNRDDFSKSVVEIAREEGVDPSCLNIEITESAAAESRERVKRLIRELRASGFTFSLDDFGVGCSTLSEIRDLSPDFIKVDKSLVKNLWDVKIRRIMDDTIQLAHRLGARVVCEGVEDQDEAEQLRKLGCDIIQGYYYYQPMPFEEFIKLFPA